MGKFIDLTGQKFGKLLVLERAENRIQPSGQKKTQWLCKCECGKNIVVAMTHLKSGHTKSCGCANRLPDLTGMKFGRLTATKQVNVGKKLTYHCICDCGNTTNVTPDKLYSGHTKSCGCYNLESLKNRSTTHGKSKTRLYMIWFKMKARCRNPKIPTYKWYGGKGVSVCDEWQEFQPFYDWSMANGYTEKLTIDRIDVNGNYEPSNCRWVDMKTQMNNTTSNVLVTYNGKTQTISQWADELNINVKTLYTRFERGFSVERALNYNYKKSHAITYMGKKQTVVEWAKEFNINAQTLYTRLNRGWSIEKALTKPVKK